MLLRVNLLALTQLELGPVINVGAMTRKNRHRL